MRILQISSAVNYGGGERHFVDLCRGLADRGHDIFVAVRPTNKWESRLDFLPGENLFHVSIRNSFGVFSARRIAEFVRRNDIEIVHAHVARDYIPANIACSIAKRPRFVLTRHVLFPLKPFNRFALTRLSRAIGVSSAVGDELTAIFGPGKVTVIRNGLSVPETSSEELSGMRTEFRDFHGIPHEAPLIGNIGELLPLKGQQDLLLAAAEIVREVPDARFLVIGVDNSIDQRHRRELKRLAKVIEIEDRITWLDWVEDLRPVLAAMDLYVSPSHSESFGLATLEAMAAGIPIVATATEGSKELLGQEELLVPIEDPVRMADRIVTLIRSTETKDELSRFVRERAKKEFSVRRMVDETEMLYKDVLDMSGRPAASGH